MHVGMPRMRLVSRVTWAICLLVVALIVLQHPNWLWVPILGCLYALVVYPGAARIGRVLHIPPWRPHEIAAREEAKRRHRDS